MKNIILFAFLFFMVAWSSSGQSLQLSKGESILAPNEVVYFQGDPAEGFVAAHLAVTNIGTSPLSVKVKKIENFMAEGAISMICWGGNCFPPEVTVSPFPEIIEPGETNTNSFSGDYAGYNIAGLSSVSYVFFDENNPNDSVMVSVNYDITSTPRSLALSNNEGNIPENGTVVVEGTPTEEFIEKVFVTNISAQPVEVLVRRIVNYIPPGGISQFCWGLCYPPEVNLSTVTLSIEPGATNSNGFEGEYNPSGMAGIARITYVFSNVADSSDFTSLSINYDADVTAVAEYESYDYTLSDAYPNPADAYVHFNYTIKQKITLRLAIFNLLGTKIMEHDLNRFEEKVSFYTGNLEEGIYFYSLLSDREILETGKLVVRH